MSDYGIMSDMSMIPNGTAIPEWSFTDRLRKAREYAGLKQEDIAPLIARKRSTISGWEKGTHRPDELALRAWAYVCGVDFEWLVYGVVSGPGGGDGSTKCKPTVRLLMMPRPLELAAA